MKITIETASQFRDQFIKYDRDVFSYHAYEALFEFLEECEPDMELDVIGICCEFTEYDNIEQAYHECFGDGSNVETDEMRDQFNEHTILIEVTGGSVIIRDF